MASPELSEMECNAQKELKEMTNKLKRLQNEIKVVCLSVDTMHIYTHACITQTRTHTISFIFSVQ